MLMQEFRDITDHRPNQLRVLHGLVEDALEVEPGHLVIVGQYEVVIVEHLTEFGGETFAEHEIAHA